MGLTCNQKLVETSLIYRTEPKQNWNAEKTVCSQSPLCHCGRKREDVWWEGFVKDVGFDLGVKEWRSYGWWEWWIYGKSWTGMCGKIRVRDGETGTRLSEWSRELIPETRWGIAENRRKCESESTGVTMQRQLLTKQKGIEVPFLQTDSQTSYNIVCNFSRRLSIRYCSYIFHTCGLLPHFSLLHFPLPHFQHPHFVCGI